MLDSDKSLFPGTGPSSGMPVSLKRVEVAPPSRPTPQFLSQRSATSRPHYPPALGKFENSFEAWSHRVRSARRRNLGARHRKEIDTQRARWEFRRLTDQVAAGKCPNQATQRPQGVERNIVITMWTGATPRPTA
jgi:hypothetical protein